MKNIHILQTKEPTRIFETNTGLQFSIIDKVRVGEYKGFHIYITSDEEIKDVRPYKGKWQLEKGHILNKFPTYLTDLSECKLVILTTDPTLIADGVQAIGDEFVELFVKNPSCEWVDIETYTNKIGVEYDANGYREMDVFGKEYRIKIPQEEPKQDWYCPNCQSYVSSESVTFEETHQTCNTSVIIEEPKQEKKPHSFCETPEEKCTMNYCDENGCQNRKRYLVEPNEQEILPEFTLSKDIFDKISDLPKHETLEEAAICYAVEVNTKMGGNKEVYQNCSRLDFIAGAKWQAERMYSEADMIEFSEWVSINFPNQHNYLRALQKYNQGLDVPKEHLVGYRSTKELFEKFKKK